MIRLLTTLLTRAETSPLALNLLNWALARAIPFNAPHKIRIISLSKTTIRVSLPYRRSNLNHLGGLHACGIATAAEFATGLMLLKSLGSSEYRIIMRSMKLDYHYQGREAAEVEFSLAKDLFPAEARKDLARGLPYLVPLHAQVHDKSGNHLCSATIEWQLKAWSSVSTS